MFVGIADFLSLYVELENSKVKFLNDTIDVIPSLAMTTHVRQ